MTRTMVTLVMAISLWGCSRKHDDPLVASARDSARHGELSVPRPILQVKSFAIGVDYYRSKLGFKLDWDHGTPADFGSVSRGDAVVFLCQGCSSSPGAWNMIFTRDVDKLYEELRRRHALIREPPTNKPWGMREMQVADPDGNVIRFGSGISEDPTDSRR